MSRRTTPKFHPQLERLEAVQLLSAGTSAAAHAKLAAEAHHVGAHPAATAATVTALSQTAVPQTEQKPNYGYLVFRITNPDRYNNYLSPPFGQVLVQSKQPVPGKVYNLLQVTVRNGTAKTFDASSGFMVRFPGQKQAFPILTGNQTWKPGQVYVFYVLSTKYYPLPSVVHSGFEFDLGGARSVGIPGPSGIFLRLKYNPATFAKTLDYIVAYGPGTQNGKGTAFGLPVTSIDQFVSSLTRRSDFAGYF